MSLKISDAEVEFILQHAHEMTVYQLADAINRSVGSVRKIAKEHSIALIGGPRKEYNFDRAHKAAEEPLHLCPSCHTSKDMAYLRLTRNQFCCACLIEVDQHGQRVYVNADGQISEAAAVSE